MIDINILRDILERYGAGNMTPDEKRIVEQWLQKNNPAESAWDKMNESERSEWMDSLHAELVTYVNKQSPHSDDSLPKLPWSRRFYTGLAAASVLLLIAFGGWYFILKNTNQQKSLTTAIKPPKADISPGINKAVLTLANGSTVLLDDVQNGEVASQGKTSITKQGTALVYNQKDVVTIQIVAFNMLATPRGGQYNLVLPDGSHVWLNAASSIRYPVAFTNHARVVEVSGEVYFEVAPRKAAGKKVPFQVKVIDGAGEQKSFIEVLGTHFNINAYDDERSVNTTLLEGKVNVHVNENSTVKGNSILLAPGQQARVMDGEIKIIGEVDVNETVAWKNGLFMMHRAEIPAVLRQLARWYDVDIEYNGGTPKGKISGDIPRSMQLSEVLKVMELSGVKCKIAGRKIIVEP